MAGPKSSPLLVRQKGDAISDLGGLARHVMGFGETEKMEFNFSTTWKLIFFLVNHCNIVCKSDVACGERKSYLGNAEGNGLISGACL